MAWEALAVDPFGTRAVGASYDAVARDYAEAFAGDLDQLPLDRAALDAFAARVGQGGRVLDAGCGPGQVGRYLSDRAVRVVGADLAMAMLRLAIDDDPRLCAVRGDVRRLPFAPGSFSGAVAFYSIQHLHRDELGRALTEIRRVLVDGGLLLLAAHLGEGEVFVDEFLGHAIDTVGGTLYDADELRAALEHRRYVIEDVRFRDSLPHEHASKRIYLRARTA